MTVENIGDGNSDGTNVIQSGEKGAFYGSTPVVQPSGAAQDALAASSSDAAAIGELITLVTELRSSLVTLGLIKGAS